jgi:hypothetical protein
LSLSRRRPMHQQRVVIDSTEPDSTGPVAPHLDDLARLMDGLFTIPGTKFQIGLDGILGMLLPGLGDVIASFISLYIVSAATRLGVPRIVVIRMLGNVMIDAALGAVPLVGDLFDFAWKSNRMNLELLRRHAGGRASTRADWLWAAGLFAVCAAAIVGLATCAYMFVRWLF